MNIEQVDPQLKNNQDIVNGVQIWEESWEKGKTYLSTSKDVYLLVSFGSIISNLKLKYRSFLNDVECMDVNVFLQVPNILLL